MNGMVLSRSIALAATLALGTACSESSGPAPHPSPTPPTNDLPRLIVSSPMPGTAGTSAAMVGLTSYVSLPPGSVPPGLRATIHDGRSGDSLTVDVLDGGFDPVAVAANAGDTLFVEITCAGTTHPAVGYQQVLVDRLPRVVRTSPPRGKKDVPLNAIIIVIFSAPIDSSTLDTGSVKLWLGTTRVTGTVRFADVAHVRAEFHPDSLLARQSDYQIALSEGIRDVNGVALDSAITVPFTTATSAPVSGLVFASVSAGRDQSCGLTTGGVVYCWGGGWLGDGSTSGSTTPVPVAGGQTFATVTSGQGLTCSVTSVGALYCWGVGLNGVYNPPGGTVPAQFVVGQPVASVSIGVFRLCAVSTASVAYCWGEGSSGTLGIAAGDLGGTPPIAVSGGHAFASVTVGDQTTCGVTTSGEAYCWGSNAYGGLGLGTSTGPEQCVNYFGWPCSTVPVAVTGSLSFARVEAKDYGACGLTTDGLVYCWGSNNGDWLGLGTMTGPEQCLLPSGESAICSRIPVEVPGVSGLVSLTGAEWYTCGLTATGAAYCWGYPHGQGVTTAAVAVPGGLTFATLSAGSYHTCGVTTAGVAYCWGINDNGELGDGTTVSSDVPVKVAGQP